MITLDVLNSLGWEGELSGGRKPNTNFTELVRGRREKQRGGNMDGRGGEGGRKRGETEGRTKEGRETEGRERSLR